MIFKNDYHQRKYLEILGKMSTTDEYHCALAYLIALDENICNDIERVNACFDFKKDSIRRDVIDQAWVTGFDRRVLQLGFNLWNNSNKADVSDVFDYSPGNLEYMIEAVKIRFGLVY